MINYVELGIGLHEYLASEGVFLEQSQDGKWQANASDERVNNLIAAYNPWPVEKAKKLDEVNQWLIDESASLVKSRPDIEQKSWSTQVAEAFGLMPLALLPSLAAERGVTVAELVEKVKQNHSAYYEAYGKLQGKRDNAKAAIKSLPDAGEFHRLQELWDIKCTA